MASMIFDKILADGVRRGVIPARTQASREWFRDKAKNTRTNAESVLKAPAKLSGTFQVGQMAMFSYDPKHKETLPYYDRFPLIFPFNTFDGGFVGINLHYLPFKLRAVLMDSLYELVNNKKYDHTTKLNLTFARLNSASRFKYFKPCVHKYLNDHVRSRFLLIDSVEWDIAMMLPVHRFEKASAQKVWADSSKKVK